MSKPIRVILVDDQDLFREALGTLLSINDQFETTGSVPGGKQAIDLLETVPADVVLMDIRMPGMDGIETTRRILEKYPQTRIIALTTFDDDDAVIGALQAGTLGYLLKDSTKEDLFTAIQTVHQGDYYFPPKITAKIVNELNRIKKNRERMVNTFHLLSRREIEVLELLGKGFSNAEIAEKLVITKGTVKNHVTHIFEKLDVKDRMQALIKYQELGS